MMQNLLQQKKEESVKRSCRKMTKLALVTELQLAVFLALRVHDNTNVVALLNAAIDQ